MVGPKAYIHLDRLIHNYKVIKEKVDGNPIMSVIKANGYGHGAVECGRALEKEGCTFLAVFTFDEAMELRDAGINTEIFVFSRLQEYFLKEAEEKNITLNFSGTTDIQILKSSKVKPKFHLKIDTGMSRLGIPFDKADEILNEISKDSSLNCQGIYSHYATADEGDLSFAEWQLAQFNRVIESAADKGIAFQYRHFSNSGTVLNLPESHFDIVRAGMLLYGAFPSDEVPTDLNIKPVMEFRGPIVSIRQIKAGTRVSYGGVWETERDTTIAVVQTGFADGIPREWYKGGHVTLNGKSYPIAGRICMDQFMIDLGNDEAEVGDEVLLFGENGDDRLLIEEIAQHIKSTPYVILTGIHGRTKRIYK